MQRSYQDALRGAGIDRRRFVQGLAAGGVLLGLPALAAQAQGRPSATATGGAAELRGTEFDLVIAETPVN
ncbi:twin-arginine translocation signal domain-containing protein, partial [Acidiphilium sp.]